MGDKLREEIRAFIPSEFYLPVVLLLALIGLLTIFYGLGYRFRGLKGYRPNLVLLIVIAVLLVIVMRSDAADRWSWMLGLLPTLLVANQAFYLWLTQPKAVETGNADGSDRSLYLVPAFQRAQEAITSTFAIKTLLIRYGFPAALLGIFGVVILNVIIKPGSFFSLLTLLGPSPEVVRVSGKNAERILLGLRMGAIGAYIYVLVQLGRRTFRHDITGASAVWCVVTLVLGPVLAATVALLWRMDAPAPDGSTWWPGGVVLFFAGYAPRRVISAIEQAAIQLLNVGGTSVVPTRLLPLTQIRGITPQIEERLNEEGIDDANALAAVDPIRLYRNTSFDLGQILAWIDEAILAVNLPKSWQALEDDGITGAMDLASYPYGYSAELPLGTPVAAVDQPKQAEALAELAKKANISVQHLLATIHRFRLDPQVQYVVVLYNHFTESSGGTGPGFSGTHSSGNAGAPG